MIMNLDTLKATLLTNSPDLKPSNKAKGLCIKCGQNALDNCYSEAGRREVAITGLCEKCFDKIADVDEPARHPVTDQNSGTRERADVEEDDDNSILSTAIDSGISLSIADTDFDTPSSDTDTSSDFSGFDGGDSGGGGASGDF
jgi:uncharacterized membrane protein YgcG